MRRKTTFEIEITHEDTDYNLMRQIDAALKALPKVIAVRIQTSILTKA